MTTKCTSKTCKLKDTCPRTKLERFLHQSDLSEDGFCHTSNGNRRQYKKESVY